MRGVIHVWTNASMGPVCATAARLCAVDLDVLDDQVVCIQILELCIALRIPEQIKDDLGRLHWPTPLAHLESLGLRGLVRVLVVHAEIHAHGLARLAGILSLARVL